MDKKKKGIKFFMKGGKKDSNSGDEASDHESKLILIIILKVKNKSLFISILNTKRREDY